MMREGDEKNQLYPNFMERTTNHIPSETMKRIPMSNPPPPSHSPLSIHQENKLAMPDLLWISKQQQQHPSTHAHPLKNTIRLAPNGIRHKFDGKQWRPLCESPDGFECRNLAFRSALCQKHFYKIHLFKRPYGQNRTQSTSSSEIPPHAIKRPVSHSYEHLSLPRPRPHHLSNEYHNIQQEGQNMYVDDDSIQVLDTNDPMSTKRNNIELKHECKSGFAFFSIDCDPQSESDIHEINQIKTESLPKTTRLNSTNTESIISNGSESPSLNVTNPKVIESIRLGLPLLTRTEEKSLASELIAQLSTDVSFTIAEQMARRRACEIVTDNYSQQLSPINITSEWFYDFLLRNPRVPMHFQLWFSSVKSVLPSSDQLIDIKIWQLGLVTRSVIPSSSVSTSSSSP